jgi:hypothetical protein
MALFLTTSFHSGTCKIQSQMSKFSCARHAQGGKLVQVANLRWDQSNQGIVLQAAVASSESTINIMQDVQDDTQIGERQQLTDRPGDRPAQLVVLGNPARCNIDQYLY